VKVCDELKRVEERGRRANFPGTRQQGARREELPADGMQTYDDA